MEVLADQRARSSGKVLGLVGDDLTGVGRGQVGGGGVRKVAGARLLVVVPKREEGGSGWISSVFGRDECGELRRAWCSAADSGSRTPACHSQNAGRASAT
ncbi:MAG TPA: hypothetical protein VFW27_07765, partial [Actinoplanes sp.]|nr:hypothetical protein [Actinoplanes sp.]